MPHYSKQEILSLYSFLDTERQKIYFYENFMDYALILQAIWGSLNHRRLHRNAFLKAFREGAPWNALFCPVTKLPLYVNHKTPLVRDICRWRLEQRI